MKVLLFAENTELDLRLRAKYYEVKGFPHWVYIYDKSSDQYHKAKRENLYFGLVPPEAFVSLIDYGDVPVFNKDRYEIIRRKAPFVPNRARFDKELIRLVEAAPYLYTDLIKIIDVPAGARFKATYKNGFEVIEYEKEVQWFTADED